MCVCVCVCVCGDLLHSVIQGHIGWRLSNHDDMQPVTCKWAQALASILRWRKIQGSLCGRFGEARPGRRAHQSAHIL